MPIPPLVATGQIISAAQMNAVRAELIAIRADMPLMADGSVGAPGLRFSLDTDTGIYRSADNSMTFAAGGAARLTVSTTGVNFHGQALTGITSLTTSGGIALQPLGNIRAGTPGAYVTAGTLAVNAEYTDTWRALHNNACGGFLGQDFTGDGMALWVSAKNTSGAGAVIVPNAHFFFRGSGDLAVTRDITAGRNVSAVVLFGMSSSISSNGTGTFEVASTVSNSNAAAAIQAGILRVTSANSDSANVLLLCENGVGQTVLAAQSSGRIIMGNLPTSSAGLSAGTLWRSGNDLKIV